MKHLIAAVLACIALASCSKSNPIKLAAIISDGMVLQQQSEVTVWGFAPAGTKVDMSTDWGFSTSATSGPNNRWKMTFASLPADFVPHSIKFESGDSSIVVNDILFGEVWLASGQSNMEMPLEGWGTDTVANYLREIQSANDDMLRIFNVGRNVSLSSEISDAEGKWLRANPENAPVFSATSYFFARQLRAVLKVPVGVVVSAWGGTPIESWIDKKAMKADSALHQMANDVDTLASHVEQLEAWFASQPSQPLVSDVNGDPYTQIKVDEDYVLSADIDSLDWKEVAVPGYWEMAGAGDFDGVVWLAKRVVIPENWVGRKLRLCLGAVDDRDVTYVNGKEIGRHMGENQYSIDRDYYIPAKIVTDTVLSVVVKVVDTGGNGGINGFAIRDGRDENTMRVENPVRGSISIEGNWKFAVAAEFYNGRIYTNDVRTNTFAKANVSSQRITESTPSSLFTGMIEPIANYRFKGAIWYQGESNIGRARSYAHMQKVMVDGWRKRMGEDLGFYYVQIAPYSYSNCFATFSACIREAQRRAEAEIPHSQMVSSLDAGSEATIHPANKQVIGLRLANCALRNDYGKQLVSMGGPRLIETVTAGQIMTLKFENADGLRIDTSVPNQFEVAGYDYQYYSATVIVNGSELNIFSHNVSNPQYVRYAPYNCSKASLFNGQGEPAPSFWTGEFWD